MHSDFEKLLGELSKEQEAKNNKPALLRQALLETSDFSNRMNVFLENLYKNHLILSSGLKFELIAEDFGFALRVFNRMGVKSEKTAFINPCYFGEVESWLPRGTFQEASLPVFIYTEYPTPDAIKSSYQLYKTTHGGLKTMIDVKPEFYRGKCQNHYGYIPSFDGNKLTWVDPKNSKEGALVFDEVFEKVTAELISSLRYR